MTAMLLCAAATSWSAGLTPAAHRSLAARQTRLVPRGRRPSTSSADPPNTASPRPAPLAVTTPLPSLGAQPTTPVTASMVSPADQATMAAEITQATRAVLPVARTGFEVYDRTAGTVLISQNANQQFAAMSVVKLLIALDTLASHGWATPDNATQLEIHQMLADSDDQIADALWTAQGGPAIVTKMASLLGLTNTRPPEVPSEWGDTLITPQDTVRVYRYITDHLPAADRDLIVQALSSAPKIAADGFPQYFGIPDAMPHTAWAVKQGWGTSGSQAVMNSTGLTGAHWRYVMVVLTSAPTGDYSRLPAVVTTTANILAKLVPKAG